MKTIMFDYNVSDSTENEFGYTENKQIGELINQIRGHLETVKDIKTFVSCDTNKDTTLESRYNKILTKNADLNIHICTVYRDDCTSSGVFGFHTGENDTIKMGASILNAIEASSGLYNLGLYPYRTGEIRNLEKPDEFDITGLNNTLTISVGVRTNIDDVKVMQDTVLLMQIAIGVTDAIRAFWDLSYKEGDQTPMSVNMIDSSMETGEYVYAYTGSSNVPVYRTLDTQKYDKNHKIGTIKTGDLITLSFTKNEMDIYKSSGLKILTLEPSISVSLDKLDLTYIRPIRSDEGDIFSSFFLEKPVEGSYMVRSLFPAKLYYDGSMYADEASTLDDVSFTIVEEKNHYGRIKNTGLWVFLDNDFWDTYYETESNNSETPDVLNKRMVIENGSTVPKFNTPAYTESTMELPKKVHNILNQTLNGWGQLPDLTWIDLKDPRIKSISGRKYYIKEPLEYKAIVTAPVKVEDSTMNITASPHDDPFTVTKEKNNRAFVPVYNGWIPLNYITRV